MWAASVKTRGRGAYTRCVGPHGAARTLPLWPRGRRQRQQEAAVAREGSEPGDLPAVQLSSVHGHGTTRRVRCAREQGPVAGWEGPTGGWPWVSGALN